jgi:cytoskeletal protein CcmA (bactofilin family)
VFNPGKPGSAPKPGPERLGDSASAPRSGSGFEPGSGVSVIGNDLTLLGEKITIISRNKLQVDGDVRGNVHGRQVLITAHGSVEGMVCAERIDVEGTVRGSIRAVAVTLRGTARVDGDITHQSLAIFEGAQFDGRVYRADAKELIPVLDPEAIAAGKVAQSEV